MEAVADLVADGVRRRRSPTATGRRSATCWSRTSWPRAVVPPVPLDWCGRADPGHARLRPDERARAGAGRARHRPPGCRARHPHPGRPRRPRLRHARPSRSAATCRARRRPSSIEHGQQFEDRGERGWRRVVAVAGAASRSSTPAAVATLVAPGLRRGGQRRRRHPGRARGRRPLRGVEAVIDKDLGAALLADADRRPTDWSSPPTSTHAVLGLRHRPRAADRDGRRRRAAHATPPPGEFASGSMGPKVDAVCRFVERPASPASSPAWPTIGSASAARPADRGARRGRPEPPQHRPDRPEPTRRTRPTETRDEVVRDAGADRGPQGADRARVRRQRARRADRRRRDRRRPGRRGDRQDRGQRRRQRLHPDHRRPGVPRGAGRQGHPDRRARSRRCRSSGPAAPTA